MKKSKLNYKFHNPNTVSISANYILKILIEANKGRVELAIQDFMLSDKDLEKAEDDRRCVHETS